jgi:hypothetical protein
MAWPAIQIREMLTPNRALFTADRYQNAACIMRDETPAPYRVRTDRAVGIVTIATSSSALSRRRS